MSDKKEDKKKADKPKEDKKKADKPKEDKKKADKPKKEAEPKKEAAAAAEKSSPAPAAAAEADAAPAAGEAKAEKPKKEKKDKKEKKEKPADGAATDAGAETGAEDKKDDGPKFDPHNPPKQPNKVENDANIEAVEKGIRAIDNDLTKIRTAIDAKNAERQKIRAEKTTLLAELKHDGESRQKVMTAHKQLSSTIASAQAARDNSRHSLEASRKNLRFTTARELEDSIADVEMQIATSTLSTTTEKKLIAELKLLKAQRAEVALYAVELEKLKSKAAAEDTKKADTKGLLDDRHALGNQIKEMKESKLAKDEKMKELRAQENAIEQKIKDMLAKRNQMQKERKKLLDSKYDYKREFEKVTRAYEKWTRKKREFDHKQGRRAAAEESTRRANAPAETRPLNTEHQKGYIAPGARPEEGTGNRRPKKKGGKGDAEDDDKPRGKSEDDDKEVDMFDVLPWSREKMLADKLAAYVKSLQGKNAAQDKEDEKKAQTEEAAKQAELVAARNASFKDKRATTVAVGKNKTMKLEDFFGKDVSNSQKAAAKPSAKKPAVAAAEKGTTQLGAAKLEEKAAAPAAPKVRKFVHAIIVLHEFKEIHLNAPADSSQLEQSLKDLASRKAFYDSNPDNDDELKPAETKAAAPAAAASSSTPVAPSESSEEKTEKSNRKKGGKAADAAADAEKSRRVAEAAADKAAAATEERTERERRRSLATEAEDAEQKRRVAEDNKAKKDAADDEAKSRNANRRNSLQVMDEEQKRRIAEEAAHPHTEKSVIAQVDAAEHQIVKKVNDDLKSSGFEAFTPTGAAAAAPAAAADS